MLHSFKKSQCLVWSLCLLAIEVHAAGVLDTPTVFGPLSITSWKAQRDQGIVKQGFDYSCGAAALATILHLYGHQATELALLRAMNVNDGMTSFEEMARVLPSLGFKAQGLAVSFEQLRSLQVPVIAYLQLDGKTHFTALLGTSKDFVWLGDPSWGNRLLTKQRFLTLWQTQTNAIEEGKILVVLPMDNKEPEREGLRMPAFDGLGIQLRAQQWRLVE